MASPSVLAANTRAPTRASSTGSSPGFDNEGTVTAGTLRAITDGAAALVVIGEEALKRRGRALGARRRFEFAASPRGHGHRPRPRAAPLLERQNSRSKT